MLVWFRKSNNNYKTCSFYLQFNLLYNKFTLKTRKDYSVVYQQDNKRGGML